MKRLRTIRPHKNAMKILLYLYKHFAHAWRRILDYIYSGMIPECLRMFHFDIVRDFAGIHLRLGKNVELWRNKQRYLTQGLSIAEPKACRPCSSSLKPFSSLLTNAATHVGACLESWITRAFVSTSEVCTPAVATSPGGFTLIDIWKNNKKINE